MLLQYKQHTSNPPCNLIPIEGFALEGDTEGAAEQVALCNVCALKNGRWFEQANWDWVTEGGDIQYLEFPQMGLGRDLAALHIHNFLHNTSVCGIVCMKFTY